MSHFNTKSIKLFPTQQELKGLEAQVIRSRHNLSTYIDMYGYINVVMPRMARNDHAGKALIDENGCSRQLRPALS